MTLSGPLCLGVRMALGVRTAFAFVLGATLLLAMAAPAYANGVHVGSRQVFEGDVGPYRLTLTTTPVVGSMHFNILLSTAGDESPVSDTELTMRGVFIDGEGLEVGPVAGYATMEGPLWFAADLPVETVGLWEFTLTVDGPLGREEVTFPVAVQGPGGVSLTLIALIVVALALFGFTLGNRMFGRRRRRSRRGRASS